MDAKKIFESPCAMHCIEFQFFNVIKWKWILFNLSLFLLFVLLSSQLTLSYFWRQLLLIKFWISNEELLQNCSWYFDDLIRTKINENWVCICMYSFHFFEKWSLNINHLKRMCYCLFKRIMIEGSRYMSMLGILYMHYTNILSYFTMRLCLTGYINTPQKADSQ